MNKTLLTGFVAVALLPLACGCSENDNPAGGVGGIAPLVNIDPQVQSARSDEAPQARSEAKSITLSDLTLSLTNADGSYSNSWAYADFPTEDKFPVGDYVMTASYGDPAVQGFELPAYVGSASVSVLDNKTTEVALTAKLANSMVSVTYTEAFKKYATNYGAQLRSGDADFLAVAADETRAAYVPAGAVTVNVSLTLPTGVAATLPAATFNAAAATHYTVTVNVNGGEVGDAVLEIILDDGLTEVTETIDLSGDITLIDGPTVTAEGFTSDEALSYVAGMTDFAPKFQIYAPAGLADVHLTTSSTDLLAKGWPQDINILSASAAEQGVFTTLGLKAVGTWRNPDKLAMLDFSGVLNNIAPVEGDSNEGTFTLTVTDKLGKTTAAPMVLKYVLEDLVMNLAAVSKTFNGTDPIDLSLEFNGTNPEKNVTIEYENERKTWTALNVLSCIPAARSASTYLLKVSSPTNIEETVKIRASVASLSAESEISLDYIPFWLTASANNMFSTYAYVQVYSSRTTAEAAAAAVTTEISADNGATWAAATTSQAGSGYLKVTGLKASTNYLVRIKDSEYTSTTVAIATESGSAIPNGDLNAETTINGSASKWENYVFSGWGTNNPLTTSQGGNYAYCRISGTIPTDDAAEGKAALIRTVGWGSGNTAVGTAGTSGVCKYTEAGLLHLGSSRSNRPSGYGSEDNKSNGSSCGPVTTDDLDCGIAFNSRPDALTFSYKYSPKNSSDRGLALIQVMDAAGKVIAQKEQLLTAASSYTTVTVPLTYPLNTAKAAKVYVKFLSSYSMDYIKRTDDNFSGPSFGGNVGKGTFMGSQLYIDQVALKY